VIISRSSRAAHGGVQTTNARLSAGAGLIFPVAICVAALVAHLGIDAVGDWALQRDAYDAIGHDSRGLIVLAILCVALAAAFRFVLGALDQQRRSNPRNLLGRFVPRTPLGFACAVVAGTVVLLVAMETLDSLVATGDVETLADAFGGSIALGLAIATVVALAAAAVAWCALRWYGRARSEIVRAIADLFTVRSPRLAVVRVAVAAPRLRSRERSSAARRSGKRGPPILS
jgi:hypothetical protein